MRTTQQSTSEGLQFRFVHVLRYLAVACIATLTCSVALGDASTLTGIVTDKDHQPIARVRVTLKAAEAKSGVLARTTTDRDGRFRVSSLVPGRYDVHLRKTGWVVLHATVTLASDTEVDEPPRSFVMTLTMYSRIAEHLRMSVLAYVLIFGLLLLVANYWIAPRPSREASVVGWSFILAAVAIACFKHLWLQAIVFALLGSLAGFLVQRFGRRIADQRQAIREEERQTETSRRQQEQEQLQLLIGRTATTATPLSPYGEAESAEGILEVKARSGYIPAGTQVVIVAFDGKTPLVDPLAEGNSES